MEYGYQKVLEVQRRCEVSFEEADRALKAEKGDVDKACVYALRRKKVNKGWWDKMIASLKNFITYRIKIRKGEKVKFDIPMGLVLAISLFVLFITSFGYYRRSGLGAIYFCIFAVTVFTGYSLEFVPGKNEEEVKLESVAQKAKTEEEVYEQNAEHEVESEDNGFNSIELK